MVRGPSFERINMINQLQGYELKMPQLRNQTFEVPTMNNSKYIQNFSKHARNSIGKFYTQNQTTEKGIRKSTDLNHSVIATNVALQSPIMLKCTQLSFKNSDTFGNEYQHRHQRYLNEKRKQFNDLKARMERINQKINPETLETQPEDDMLYNSTIPSQNTRYQRSSNLMYQSYSPDKSKSRLLRISFDLKLSKDKEMNQVAQKSATFAASQKAGRMSLEMQS